MNFSIINLGCKVNRVESDSFGAFLLSNGACATSLEFANLVIVNTCTVTGDAEKKPERPFGVQFVKLSKHTLWLRGVQLQLILSSIKR